MVQSALVGQPPLTDNDLWIVKGDLLITGYTSADPTKGLMIPPFRPPLNLYHFESRQSAMVASSSVGIIAMIFFTGARLMVRKFMKDLKFGLDDWLIIPALVRLKVLLLTRWGIDLRLNEPGLEPAVANPTDSRGQGSRRWETYIRRLIPRALHAKLGASRLSFLVDVTN